MIFFEGANKLVLIEAAIGRRPCPPQHRPFLNINVNICNMHVEKKSHVNMEHLFLMVHVDPHPGGNLLPICLASH